MLFPTEPDFSINEKQLRGLLDFLEVKEIYIVDGESGAQPEVTATCGSVTILSTPESAFFESRVSVDRAVELWMSGKALSTSLILGIGESKRLKAWAEALKEIDGEIAGEFCPWDTSITLGPWEEVDHDDLETVVACGPFKIDKSDNRWPNDPDLYLSSFRELQETREFEAHLAELINRDLRWYLG